MNQCLDTDIWSLLTKHGSPCPVCGGTRGWKEPCEDCRGTGWMSKDSAESIEQAMVQVSCSRPESFDSSDDLPF